MKYFAKRCPVEGEIKYCKKLELFLCSRDIQVGDIIHFEGKEFLVENERDAEFARKSRFKVLGKISSDATWVKEDDEFNEDEIQKIYAADVIKDFRNGQVKDVIFLKEGFTKEVFVQDLAEHWAEHINLDGHNYGYTVHWGDAYIHHIKIKGPCGHFH